MIRLAILGATGMAGREALLHQEYLDKYGSQYAEITCVTASPGSAGKRLGEVTAEKEDRLVEAYSFWRPMQCPEDLENLRIDPPDPDIIARKADYVISALGSDIAKELEPALRERGVHVFSNASAFRWDPTVPLMIPEVNPHDIKMLESQRTPGKQVCNPNCTTAGYVPVIYALESAGNAIERVILNTQQAISGKGDAIAEPDYVDGITGNVTDDWLRNKYNDEEWKLTSEPQKILGRVRTRDEVDEGNGAIIVYGKDANCYGSMTNCLPIHSHTTRVCTQYGHLENITIDFKHQKNVAFVVEELFRFEPSEDVAALPTTPDKLFHRITRMPEPGRDVYKAMGMGIVIGDLVQRGPRTLSFSTLTHNLRRGATWAGRQGLELYLHQYEGMFRKAS